MSKKGQRIPGSDPRGATASARHYVATVAAVAALGGLLFGYDTGVMSGALLYLRPDFGLDPMQEGFVTASLLLGAALGALAGGSVADLLGRRGTLILGGGGFVAGALWCSLTGGVGTMVAARFLLGLAVGAVSIVVPMYISEKAPPAVRGRLVSLNSLMIVIGQLLAYVVNAGLAHTGNWRLMLGLAAVPGVVLMLGMMVVPDTPVWYARRGRMEDARRVASRSGITLEEAGVAPGAEEAPAALPASTRAEWRFLVAHRWALAAVGVAVVIAIIQQVSGFNAIIYFAARMLEDAGVVTRDSIYLQIVIGVVSVASCAVGLAIVDRVGRTRLLLIGLVGNAVSLVVLSVTYPSAWATSLFFMAVFVAFQQSSVSVTTWLLISELVPVRVRGVGMGVAGLCLWLANWAVAQFFLPLVDAVGGRWTFFSFACLVVAAIVFVITVVPETAGKSLAEVSRHFGGRGADVEEAPTRGGDDDLA